MEVFDRTIPADLAAIHDEAADLREWAKIRFSKGMPAGSLVKGRHEADNHGESTIRLVEDYDNGTLAHELMHLLYYRRGYPVTTIIPFDSTFFTVGQTITCAVSHPAMHEEARERRLPDAYWRDPIIAGATLDEPDEPAVSEASFLQAWRIADAISLDPDAVADVANRCRDEFPNTWAVVQKLVDAMARCKGEGAGRWRKIMVELVEYFDALARAHHPDIRPPSQSIGVSLIVTEPQLSRIADRMIEVTTVDDNTAALMQKQDHSLFYFRYLSPKAQKRELAALKADLKALRTEAFLDKHMVPYTVDLRATAHA